MSNMDQQTEVSSETPDTPASVNEYKTTMNGTSESDDVTEAGNGTENGLNEEDNDIDNLEKNSISSNGDVRKADNENALNGGHRDAEMLEVTKEEDKQDMKDKKVVLAAQNVTKEGDAGDVSSQEPVAEGEEEEKEEEEKDEWMDILGNGLLKKKVLRKGDGVTTRPKRGQRLVLTYCARTEDDTVVDSETDLMITLGDCDVIQAIDLAVALMERGELAEVQTDGRFAYGAIGREPDIPPNTKLIYEVELVRIEDPLDIENLSLSERLQHGELKKDKGNFWYSRQDYSSAINVYTKALKILDLSTNAGDGDNNMRQKILDMRLKVYNNLAACQLKVEAYDAVLKSCNEVLKQQPNNVKALFRKGKAFEGNSQLGNAITSLRRALQLEPESKLIHQELSKLVNRKKAEDMKEQKMYKKMFGIKEDANGKEKESWVSKNILITGGAVLAAAVTVGIAVAVKSLNN